MKLYFIVVIGVVLFIADVTFIQTCLSMKDDLMVLIGFSLAVVSPVAGYMFGKILGTEYFAWKSKK